MEQNHPIPQQISSYQFKLVGDMTLKQFFQLAGGCLVALLFYATPLHPLIKWPIIVFFVVLGIALAFFPLEERPLERWIIAFFRSIYSPTIFSWKKSESVVKYYQTETNAQQNHSVIAPQGEAALNTYLATPSTSTSFFSKLEEGEKNFLSKMGDLFGPGSPNKGTMAVEPTESVTPKIDLQIPASPVISIPTQTKPRLIVEETTRASDVETTGVKQVAPERTLPLAQQPVFSPDAAPPNPSSIVNTVSGQVIDPDGKIIEGAILEIRDISGRPVRALKTNKLGHFYIVTALLNGNYEIITEKDGFEFTPVTFEANGTLIPPIAIRSTRKIELNLPTQNLSGAAAMAAIQ